MRFESTGNFMPFSYYSGDGTPFSFPLLLRWINFYDFSSGFSYTTSQSVTYFCFNSFFFLFFNLIIWNLETEPWLSELIWTHTEFCRQTKGFALIREKYYLSIRLEIGFARNHAKFRKSIDNNARQPNKLSTILFIDGSIRSSNCTSTSTG